MTAAELRAAADHLDALADAATPGPWEVTRKGQTHPRPLLADVKRVGGEHIFADCCGYTGTANSTDAAYIATMHPGVAEALAAWLRQIATTVEADEHDGTSGAPGCDCAWCESLPHALAVARLILGGAA